MNPPIEVVSLSPFELLRPEKIRWISRLQPGQDVLDSLNSKSLRKFLTHADARCQEHAIQVETFEMTPDRYAQWYEFYAKEMRELDHEVIASPEWLTDKLGLGYQVYGIFYTQQNRLIGGSVILVTQTFVSLAFKASERMDLSNDPDSSLGAVLEYDFLRFAQNKGKTISSGRCRNAFGVHNTLGYLAFKLRFGYQASLPDEPTIVSEVPMTPSRKVLFFASTAHDPHLLPYYFSPTPAEVPELTEVQRKLPSITILPSPLV